ncbi:MAG: glycosyltransferase [Chitinophagales bacterium]
MKKIVIIGPAFPYRGGIAAFGNRLAQAFQEEMIDCEVSVYTFKFQYPNFLFPGKTQFSTDSPPPNIWITQNIHSINPLNWWRVGKEIAALQPDIVLTQFWLPFMSPCLGSINRQIKRHCPTTKIVAVSHNIIPHEKRFGDFQLTNYFVQSCDAFLVMSKSVLTDLEQFTNTDKKVFLPHPIYDNFGKKVEKSLARKFLKIKNEDKILLFFGLIRNYKGLDILLEAMTDERLQAKNIRLLIAGEYYDDQEKYEAYILQYDLKKYIISKPEFIADAVVKHYFCAADLIVQPYKTATQSGISQIAYHFERPMLVTNVGGLPEIVPDGVVGYVVEPNALAIANAILDFYENEKETFFSQNVAIEKKRFSWKNMVNGILALTDEI